MVRFLPCLQYLPKITTTNDVSFYFCYRYVYNLRQHVIVDSSDIEQWQCARYVLVVQTSNGRLLWILYELLYYMSILCNSKIHDARSVALEFRAEFLYLLETSGSYVDRKASECYRLPLTLVKFVFQVPSADLCRFK